MKSDTFTSLLDHWRLPAALDDGGVAELRGGCTQAPGGGRSHPRLWNIVETVKNIEENVTLSSFLNQLLAHLGVTSPP